MAAEPRRPGDPLQHRAAHIIHALLWSAAMLAMAAVPDREVGRQLLPWMIVGWFAGNGLLASVIGPRRDDCGGRLFP